MEWGGSFTGRSGASGADFDRLVKDTVNFDDPGTYHFYYGDKSGHPGTIHTFFPFVSAGRGRSGSGMVDTVTFAVSAKSLDGWIVRLAERGVDASTDRSRVSRVQRSDFAIRTG